MGLVFESVLVLVLVFKPVLFAVLVEMLSTATAAAAAAGEGRPRVGTAEVGEGFSRLSPANAKSAAA